MNCSIIIRAITVFALPGLVACGSKETRVVDASPVAHPAPKHNSDTISVSSEVGALDEDAVNGVFKKAQRELMNCLRKGADRVELLGGEVTFYVGINLSGRAEDTRLEHSTLGDRDTESCMLSVLRSKSWPKPVGGRKGEVHKPFSFDMPNDVRTPFEWSANDVDETVKKLHKHAEKCTGGRGPFQVTAYVDTNGSAISVGVAPPDTNSESKIDCLVEVVKSAKFKSPGSYPAKVSFEL